MGQPRAAATILRLRVKGTGRREQNLLAFSSIAVNLSVSFEEPTFVNVALSFVSCYFWKTGQLLGLLKLASGPGQMGNWAGISLGWKRVGERGGLENYLYCWYIMLENGGEKLGCWLLCWCCCTCMFGLLGIVVCIVCFGGLGWCVD
uniref:Uncharacterized protein n=1 Tax=Solanum tuberosum TaxID=4113 RepID=M1C4D0_SOLTU